VGSKYQFFSQVYQVGCQGTGISSIALFKDLFLSLPEMKGSGQKPTLSDFSLLSHQLSSNPPTN
jgi:hypothetical protein